MSRKIFVVDTSVMLYDKEALHQFAGNDVVLPLCILEELDKFKDQPGLLGESARYINRFLDIMREAPKDEEGWRLSEEDIRFRFVTKPLKPFLPEGLDSNSTDNHIIACAKYLQEALTDVQVIIITKDINLRVKCDAVGVTAEDYFKDHIDSDISTLSGWTEINLSRDSIDEFFEVGYLPLSGSYDQNQFIVGKNDQQSFLGMHKNGTVYKLVHKLEGLISVDPRNCEQSFALEALLDPNIPLVTLTGIAGSGKTFLTLMAGLSGLKPQAGSLGNELPAELVFGYERLVITRTLQPVGRDLGYLPGSMADKMAPWLMPIFDNVRHAFKDLSYFKAMMDKGDVEIAPIPYIRGRTFNNSFVIVDEAQNATIHQLKTIVTRIGQGSKIVLLGDIDQIDTPYIDRQSSGLSIVIDKFRQSPLSAHINLSRGQRSDLASVASIIL